MSGARFLVIVPTYNERDNLPRKVPLVLEQDKRLDVLVVDDASPDGTGTLADEMAAENDRVHVLHRTAKDGLGKAYLAGFDWGISRRYDLLIEMDADISHPADALPQLIEAAKDHQVVIGSRYVDGRVTVSNWPMSRLLVSYFGSLYARTITRMPVRDATGGFNVWHREVLEAVRPRPGAVEWIRLPDRAEVPGVPGAGSRWWRSQSSSRSGTRVSRRCPRKSYVRPSGGSGG